LLNLLEFSRQLQQNFLTSNTQVARGDTLQTEKLNTSSASLYVGMCCVFGTNSSLQSLGLYSVVRYGHLLVVIIGIIM